MNKGRTKIVLLALISALLFTGVLGSRAHEGFLILEGKVVAQQKEIDGVQSYIERYGKLQSVTAQFDARYPPASRFSDWGSYFNYIDFSASGLVVDRDGLSLNLSEPGESLSGLGLGRACVGSNQGANLVVAAPSYGALLSGLEKLLSRHEIQADSILLLGDRDPPQARVVNFCLLFRKDSSGGGR